MDHRPQDPLELERVKAEGGMIFNGRLSGTLAITRAMGDHIYKSQGLSAKPTIQKHILKPFDKFLVIASDGVWDFVEESEVIGLCRDDLTVKEIAENITKTSI